MYSTALHLAAVIGGALGTPSLVPRHTGSTQDPRALLEQGIEALGGAANIAHVSGVTFVGSRSYRTKTLMQSYSLIGVDRGVSVLGTQNTSFSFGGPHIKQRLEVNHQLDGFWSGFSRPNLDPLDFTIVVRGGDDGFAAVIEGNRNMFDPSAPPQGYVDGLLAAYFIKEANKMSPFLLSTILSNDNFTYREEALWTGERLPAVYDRRLDLAVLFDPETRLPYAIRSVENHDIFGPSTNDMVVYAHTRVNGVMFPTGFKQFYNGRHLIMTSGVSEVLVNPSFDPAFFDGPSDRSRLQSPATSRQHDFSEIGERSGVYIWFGAFSMTAANLSASQPFPELPGLWYLEIGNGRPAYRQAVLALEDAVIVMDSPPHQSLLVLEWVEKTLGRKVTHVWPTHHHHDHASGLKDYVNVGAKVIVPVEVLPYYSAIPGIEFVTFTADKPLALNGDKVHARFIHMQASLHSFDHTYAVMFPAQPTANSTMALFDADHGRLDAETTATPVDDALMTELVKKMTEDRVAEHATLISAHVALMPVAGMFERVRIRSRGYSTLDFKYL